MCMCEIISAKFEEKFDKGKTNFLIGMKALN